MEECIKLIKSMFPNIDTDIQNYVEGVLESTCEDLETDEDVFEGIGEVLQDIDQSKTENEVKDICIQLATILKPSWKDEEKANKHDSLPIISSQQTQPFNQNVDKPNDSQTKDKTESIQKAQNVAEPAKKKIMDKKQ